MPDDFHVIAKPWAVIKHGLLQYVDLFVGKLGGFGKPVHFVDGFAGSGRLEDGTEGSPLRVAAMAANPRVPSRHGVLRCINVEEKPGVFKKLEAATAEYVASGHVTNLPGDFESNLPRILKMIGDSPTLFFIDPFGTQGAELSTLLQIAEKPRGREVLIRFDDTRVKRLIRLADNQRESLDATQRKIAEALGQRVAQFATDEDVTKTLALLDAEERIESRQVLIDGYRRIVLEKTKFRYGLSYPLRNPQTGGHRYFIVHFCAHPDGYVHMANFMAKAERAYQRLEAQKGDFFAAPGQIEFPGIQEHFDNQMQAKNRAAVVAKLPEIIDAHHWRGHFVAARDVFAAIVDSFGWNVLRKEYFEALRELRKAGRAEFSDLDDNGPIRFPK